MRQRERGVALVTAILIVAIIATLATSLALGQQVWLRQAQNLTDQVQAEQVRRGALEFAALALAQDARNSRTSGSDNLNEEWAQQIPPLPVDGGAVGISIADAQARFNLNNLAQSGPAQGQQAQQLANDIRLFRDLLTLNDLPPALVDTLLDWVDLDSSVRPGGAEDLDYLSYDPPYRAANKPLTSVDELRLVKGFTAEVVDKLRPYVVALPDRTSININTASAELLAALLQVDTAQAEQIVRAREKAPFKNVADLQRLLPTGRTAAGGFDVKSTYFIVSVETRIGRTQRRTEALIHRPIGGNQKVSVLWFRQPSFPIVIDEDKT